MVGFDHGVVRSLSIVALLGCVILGACSCAQSGFRINPPAERWEHESDKEATAVREQMRSLREEITALIGNAPCRGSGDCGAIGFGVAARGRTSFILPPTLMKCSWRQGFTSTMS